MIKINYFLLGILLTITITIVLEILIINNIDFYNKTRNIYRGKEKVILLGSSRTLGSFIPESIVRDNTYNYGMSGTSNKLWINQLYDLSKDEFSQTIIINIDETKLLDINDESKDGDFRSYLKTPKESFVYNHLSQFTRNKLKPFPLYYFGEIDVFISKFIRERIGGLGFYNNGCRVELNILNENQFQKSDLYKPIEETIISKKTHNTLKSIEKTYYKLKMDRIIFVSIPVYGKLNENFTLNKIKLEYPDLGEFYDLSQLYKKREFFYDRDHPSLSGAIILSDTIRNLLKSSK